jgi:hypothetical protein
MRVRKVRGQDKVGRVILSKAEVDSFTRMGVSIEDYVKIQLYRIAKQRRWKWYLKQHELKTCR